MTSDTFLRRDPDEVNTSCRTWSFVFFFFFLFTWPRFLFSGRRGMECSDVLHGEWRLLIWLTNEEPINKIEVIYQFTKWTWRVLTAWSALQYLIIHVCSSCCVGGYRPVTVILLLRLVTWAVFALSSTASYISESQDSDTLCFPSLNNLETKCLLLRICLRCYLHDSQPRISI